MDLLGDGIPFRCYEAVPPYSANIILSDKIGAISFIIMKTHSDTQLPVLKIIKQFFFVTSA